MPRKIFVGNLPYEAEADQLLAWFRRNGVPADAVDISVDNLSGHPRGYGFVQIHKNVAQRCILACNGQDFLGRSLIVNETQPLLDRVARGRV